MQIVSKISHVHCHYPISCGSQRRASAITVVNKGTSKPTAILITIHDQKINIETQPPGIKQQQLPTNNIPSATITENESLDAIFPFELKEPLDTPLFSRAAFEEKPIMAIYTDIKINSHFIKLILNSGSAGSIITRQFMDQLGCRVNHTASARIITADGATKTPIGEINDFQIEVNGIIVPIKVLITQELVLSQNGQHTRVPAMCGHFKATNTTAPLIDLEEEKPKPTWEVYQVLWANKEHNELLPILS
ncbi:hypothetical protein G9A89_002532 [Geosiphon pyriformis]|nr:hypothetical protein G9A89_002532 [Geosiphon pyriformis]